MNYSHPYIRKIARRIPILCAIYFALFAFAFLFFLQRDLLAQAQFRLSDGTTVYHPLLAASLCTLLLVLLGSFLSRMLRWLPLRLKALAWYLPFLLVGGLTHWRFPQFGDVGQAPGWGTVALLLVAYGVSLFVVWQFADSSKENATFSTYLWPNALLLVVFTTICIGLSNTDIGVHRTLKAVRLLEEHRYEEAVQAAQWERHPSRQLSAATALALSETGQLGERLFAFSQPYGSEGLLPALGDSLLFSNLPRAVGNHLGYKKGDRTPATLFLQLVDTMPKSHSAVHDYLLCAHLLDKRLDRFVSALPTDSLSLASLPLHYREAWLLNQHLNPEASTDSLSDAVLAERFAEFQALLNEAGTKAEREFRCRERFGTTYWTYFYFN